MSGLDGWPPLVELRQYTLRPDRRDELITLFDAEFVESQGRLGMGIYGQFRDLDDPNRFVWLRGYPSEDADRRAAALAAFYGGPVWRAHSVAANATMVDSDDVLLLTPLREVEPFAGDPAHPPVGSDPPGSVVDVTVCRLASPADSSLLERVADQILPLVASVAAAPVAGFRSSDVPNTFPALPVRSEQVVAWVVRLADAAAHADFRRLQESAKWRREVWAGLRTALREEPTRLRLAPTGRSRLR